MTRPSSTSADPARHQAPENRGVRASAPRLRAVPVADYALRDSIPLIGATSISATARSPVSAQTARLADERFDLPPPRVAAIALATKDSCRAWPDGLERAIGFAEDHHGNPSVRAPLIDRRARLRVLRWANSRVGALMKVTPALPSTRNSCTPRTLLLRPNEHSDAAHPEVFAVLIWCATGTVMRGGHVRSLASSWSRKQPARSFPQAPGQVL